MVETKVKVGFVIVMLFALIGVGTIAFHYLEQWSYVDSFYFSAITLTTIGYGELHPTHDVSKIFTVFYALLGVALVLYALSVIAKWYVQRSQQFEEHEIAYLKGLLRGSSVSSKQKKRPAGAKIVNRLLTNVLSSNAKLFICF